MSVATVSGFVWDLRPHAGLALRRPPVWFGVGGREEVIQAELLPASKTWLPAHSTVQLVELPGESHQLTPTFTHAATSFTVAQLRPAAR